MELNGKCEIIFKEWLLKYLQRDKEKQTISTRLKAASFKNEIDAMKFGVYQDFFWQNEIFISINPHLGGGYPVCFVEIQWRDSRHIDHFIEIKQDNGELMNFTIEEARTEAIKTANNLINSL